MENIKAKEIGEKLLKISKEIRKVSITLKDLVRKKKVLDESFGFSLRALKILKEQEDNIYEEIKSNASLITEILNFDNNASQDATINADLKESLNLLFASSEDKLIKRRISNRLADLLFRSEEVSLIPKGQYKDFELRIQQYLDDDFVNTVLMLMMEYLNNPEYQDIKDELYEAYFNLNFMFKIPEDSAVFLAFSSPDKLYWDTPTMVKFYNLEEDKMLEQRKTTGSNVFDEVFANIVSIDDEDLKDKRVFLTFTLSEIISRAGMLFMGKERVEDIKTSVKLDYPKDANIEGESLQELAKRALKRVHNLLSKYDLDANLPVPTNFEFIREEHQVNLSKENYEDLEKLLEVTKEIKDVINSITLEEIKGKKNPDLIIKLKNLRQIEQSIYNKIGSDANVVADLLYYMIGDTTYSLSETILAIKDGIDDEIIKSRILYKLSIILNSKENLLDRLAEDVMESLDDCEDEEETEVMEVEESSLNEDEENPVNNLDDGLIAERKLFLDNNIEFSIARDMVGLILRVLNEYLNREDLQFIKDILIRIKNDFGFAFSNVEEEFLENDFNINQEMFLEAKLFSSLSGGDSSDLERIQDHLVGDVLFSLLPSLKDIDVLDNDTYGEAMFIQILIRSSLILASDYLEGCFYQTLQREIMKSHTNKGLKDIIEESFDHLDEDKSIPVTISYGIF